MYSVTSVMSVLDYELLFFFFFQAEDGIRDLTVTGVQTCALPISATRARSAAVCHRGSRLRITPPPPPRSRARRDTARARARRAARAVPAPRTGASPAPRRRARPTCERRSLAKRPPPSPPSPSLPTHRSIGP